MLHKLKNRKSEGFTIIEVLIVLAIAGLILLIVFLAVPALQRNARNTTIKNDASVVGGGISTYESDNNGTAPTSIAGTGTVVIKTAAGASENASVNGATVVTTVAAAPAVGAPAAGTINVLPGKTCSGTVSARAFAVYYSIETTSGITQQCLDT